MNIPGGLTKYDPLTPKHMLGLAAPQTWAATLAPVLVAGAYSLNRHGKADIPLFYLTLIAALLMQSSANILNDYYDYKKEPTPSTIPLTLRKPFWYINTCVLCPY